MDHYDPVFAKEVIPKLASEVPAQRMGEEAEVSSAIVFLLSPAAAYISGACINIDGGSVAQQQDLSRCRRTRTRRFTRVSIVR